MSRFRAMLTDPGGNYNAPDYPAIIGPQSLAGLINVVVVADRNERANAARKGVVGGRGGDGLKPSGDAKEAGLVSLGGGSPLANCS